jgi:hypothetical protein
MLDHPLMKDWLAGIEPAWKLLDPPSFHSLREEPAPRGTIRLATDLTDSELQQSAVARNTLLLLDIATKRGSLKLTAKGNLTRLVVAETIGLFAWPDLDWDEHAWLHKVVNELDFEPLYLVHGIARAAQLFRKHKGELRATPSGRRLLNEDHRPALQAVLFHVALWYCDFWRFALDPLAGWPRGHIGVVLWCLSVAANDWQSCERLTRLCTVPTGSVIESERDAGSRAMEARILGPLVWFGLIERRWKDPARRYFSEASCRKAPLFDRFLSFDVSLGEAGGPHH